MAKARLFSTFGRNMPKLVFREQGQAKTDGPRQGTLKETEIECNWIHVNKSQSFKTLFLGDTNVGKTCLAKLFIDRCVLDNSTNTIGFDHHVKEMELEGGIAVKLQVWDTAGMEQFRNAMVTKYYRNADGIVFVFDLTRKETFQNIENWVSEVQHYSSRGLESVKMVLIGNKCDREQQRQVTYEEAKAFADRFEMVSYYELSAKVIDTLTLLDEIFTTLATEMLRNRERLEVTQSLSVQRDIINLSDDWVVLETPREQIPRSVYSPQEESIRRKRQRLGHQRCGC